MQPVSAHKSGFSQAPRSKKIAVSVLCIAALVSVAFTAQAAGIISFERGQSYVVMVDGEVAGNYQQEAAAQDAAGEAKQANPDALVGYFGTRFHEALLAEETPTPVPSTPVPVTPVPVTPVPPTPVAPTPTAEPTPLAVASELPTRLLGVDDFQYQGSFTVPDASDGQEGSLSYAGAGLAYNPARDSLFITGHDWHQMTAEITIPQPQVAAEPADLPRASFIRTPEDATDGTLPNLSDPADFDYGRIGGYLVDGDQLIVSGFDYYDAGNEQVRSHLATDIDLGASTQMLSLAEQVPARWLGGWMAHIPEQWQPSFGGDPWLTGMGGISIAGNSSVGPAAATFSPASLQGDDPAQLVLGYPLANALDGPETQSDVWNLTSAPRGMVFPTNTASVLFFGAHGSGPYCYGLGSACDDPVQPHQGTHAYPYRTQVWAYSAADMVEVFNGDRESHTLQPYLATGFDLPYSTTEHEILGVAYDEATGRIFISQARAEKDRPVIHVYTVGA